MRKTVRPCLFGQLDGRLGAYKHGKLLSICGERLRNFQVPDHLIAAGKPSRRIGYRLRAFSLDEEKQGFCFETAVNRREALECPPFSPRSNRSEHLEFLQRLLASG